MVRLDFRCSQTHGCEEQSPCVLSGKNDDGLVQKNQRVWQSLMSSLEKCVPGQAIAVSSLFGCAGNVA